MDSPLGFDGDVVVTGLNAASAYPRDKHSGAGRARATSAGRAASDDNAGEAEKEKAEHGEAELQRMADADTWCDAPLETGDRRPASESTGNMMRNSGSG